MANIQFMMGEIFPMLTSFLPAGVMPAVGTELFDDKGMLMAVITCSGILIVFLILLLLIFIFYAYGGIFRAVTNSKASKNKKTDSEKSAAQQQRAAAPSASSVPVDDGAIPDEIIAVIAAAVAALEDGGKYSVKRVTRAQRQSGSRSAWAAMGVYENTRPF